MFGIKVFPVGTIQGFFLVVMPLLDLEEVGGRGVRVGRQSRQKGSAHVTSEASFTLYSHTRMGQKKATTKKYVYDGEKQTDKKRGDCFEMNKLRHISTEGPSAKGVVCRRSEGGRESQMLRSACTVI